MKYSIITTADWHWGVMNPFKQFNEMMLLINTIKNLEKLDLLVIAGDIFDNKLSMNGTPALTVIKFMNLLYDTCKEKNTKIRVVLGTESHDNNQLKVFDYFNDGDLFRIIEENTYEETLPGLKCLYAPDENIETKSYLRKYIHNIDKEDGIDIMFFHGTFDELAPDIMVTNAEQTEVQNVIFPAKLFSSKCNLILGGHWHDGTECRNIYYTRSFSRWCFNEPNSKGCIFTLYDTDSKKYIVERLVNDITDIYDTYIVDTSIYNNFAMYNELITDILTKLEMNTGDVKDKTYHARIKFIITNNATENEHYLELLRYKFSSNKNVKITIKDDLQSKKKKERSNEKKEYAKNNSFIIDKSVPISTKLHRYIFETKGENVPIEVIDEILKEYNIN